VKFEKGSVFFFKGLYAMMLRLILKIMTHWLNLRMADCEYTISLLPLKFLIQLMPFITPL
jgi:hypothetical protein